jgi:hypothetical protein
MSKYERAERVPTWTIFLESLGFDTPGSVPPAPLPEVEDHADAGIRAMQRARRRAWLHARYRLRLSVFESIRLSQRLTETFSDWTRSPDDGLSGLSHALRATERESRKTEPIRMRLRFVEALDDSSRYRPIAECETVLEAYREGQRRYAAELASGAQR